MGSSRSEQPRGVPDEHTVHPLSVDAAVLSLAPRFRAEEPAFIAGRVMAVRTYAPWHYVDLAGTEAQLTCRVPHSAPAPDQGQHLIVHGVLSVQPSKFKGGLEVLLTGTILGTYQQTRATSSGTPLRRIHTPQRLGRLFAQEGTPRITVLATRTAWEDASRSGLVHGSAFFHWIETNFARLEGVLDVLHDYRDDPDSTAFAILRGGGDARGLEIWNDPDVVEAMLRLHRPVYTALGHSTDIVLADRYADEAFDTPTGFGNAVGQILEERRWRARRAEEAREAVDHLAKAQRQVTSLRIAVGIVAFISVVLLLLLLIRLGGE
jgi:hypothetical protein